MAGTTGNLTIADSSRRINDIGQELVYPMVTAYLQRHREALQAQVGLFVQGQTAEHTFHYKHAGGGFLEERGADSLPSATKPSGGWDVSLPLGDVGRQWASNDVDLAYLTGADFTRTLETIATQDRNTMRRNIFRALFNNVNRTFVDPTLKNLSLTIRALANGDATLYPPVIGAEDQDEAQHNHYLVSGYAAADISNTNNPLPVARDHLEEHFGTPNGYGSVVVMANRDHTAKLTALGDFKEVEDRFIRSGQDKDVPVNLPNVPGRILGRSDGVWVVEWRQLPANYIVAIDLEQDKPLMYRHDPLDTGLGIGLQMVPGKVTSAPFDGAFFRHRYGLGAVNRLNCLIMQLTTNGSYSIPNGYS